MLMKGDDIDKSQMDQSNVQYDELVGSVEKEMLEEDEEDLNNDYSSNRYNTRKTTIKQRDFDDDEETDDDDVGREKDDFENDAMFDKVDNIHIAALNQYFTDRLQELIVTLGGRADTCEDMKVCVLKRRGGLSSGTLEMFYQFQHDMSRRLRYRVEVLTYLNILPTYRTYIQMSKQQLHILAVEIRERNILTQLLGLSNFQCDKVLYQEDQLCIFANEVVQQPNPNDYALHDNVSAIHDQIVTDITSNCNYKSTGDAVLIAQKQYPTPNVHQFFSYGNVTVLSWGKVVLYPGFHTQAQIYPLGFKCIRQEHDLILNKVVDCLCEIDCEPTSDADETPIPLFRLSISWKLDDDSEVVRVYEAKSPQQAWQAAMLESVSNISTVGHDALLLTCQVPRDQTQDNSASHEDFDDEEKAIRKEIRETRREYFRCLRQEQGMGHKPPIKPRLSLDSTDSFCDEEVMRLIEGMEGVLQLPLYTFMNHRERDGGRKKIVKGLKDMHSKLRRLEKIYIEEAKSRQKKGRPPLIQSQLRTKVRHQAIPGFVRVPQHDDRHIIKSLAAIDHDRRALLRVKTKDVDKKVRDLREECIKYMKCRRAEAKIRVEVFCDNEESALLSNKGHHNKVDSNKDNSTDRSALPESGQPFFLDHDALGHILEIWDFLTTFSVPLGLSQVPSFSHLRDATILCDRDHQILASFCYPSNNIVASGINQTEAKDLLNSIAIVLCKCLMKDFFRLYSIDCLDESMSDTAAEMINSLTWKEFARVIVSSKVCKDIGMSDSDFSGFIKGRGYIHIAEGPDRKIIRLIRKRICSNYEMRDDFQESVYGFNSGVCVSIPAPSRYLKLTASWKDVLFSLKSIHISNSWLIYHVINTAVSMLEALPMTKRDQDVRDSLKACISPAIFKLSDASDSKYNAIEVVKTCGTVFDGNKVRFMRSLFDSLEAKAVMGLVCFDDLRRYEGNFLVKVATPKLNVLRDGAALLDKTTMPPSSCEEGISDIEVEEMLAVEKLSIAMQRCFTVIRDIMSHPDAELFCDAVDTSLLPAYSKSIAQPLSLSEIRTFLAHGNYCDSISQFYTDVNVVFENSLAFNGDSSAVTQLAFKLMNVFERMFFETVLVWNEPAPCASACIACRLNVDAIDKPVQCERCDSLFHRHCVLQLHPTLIFPLRVEWYCPGCIEQRTVAFAHPNNTSHVYHPDLHSLHGEVVGIEQIDLCLCFVVEFPVRGRELWTGCKVRQHLLPGEVEQNAVDLPTGYTYEDYDYVCGLARGYSGWNSPHSLLPSNVSDPISKHAADKSVNDPLFINYRNALSILSYRGSDVDLYMGSNEWLCILRALSHVLIGTAPFIQTFSKLDDEADKFAIACHDIIQAGDASIETLIRRSSVTIGQECVAKQIEVSESPPIDDTKVGSKRKVASDSVSTLAGGTSSKVSKIVLSNSDTESEDNYNINDNASDDDSDENDNKSCTESVVSQKYDDYTMSAVSNEDAFACWNSRRLARRKGREDAMMTRNVIHDTIASVAFIRDGSNSSDPDHDISNAVLSTAVKLALFRPNESVDIDEWFQAMNRKLSACMALTTEDSVLCKYCGFDEVYLASPFVYAQTWQEWEAEGDSAFSIMGDRRRKPIERGAEHKDWTPANLVEEQIEKGEFAKQNQLMLRNGSVVAHELCADCMNFNRQTAFSRVKLAGSQAVADVLLGIGRAKTMPIGSDDNGDQYWIFSGLSYLFISSTSTSTSLNNYESSGISNRGCVDDSITINNLYCSKEYVSRLTLWHVYSSDADVGGVLNWLNKQSSSESQLVRTLQLLFPNAITSYNTTAEVRKQREKEALDQLKTLQMVLHDAVSVDNQPAIEEIAIEEIDYGSDVVFDISDGENDADSDNNYNTKQSKSSDNEMEMDMLVDTDSEGEWNEDIDLAAPGRPTVAHRSRLVRGNQSEFTNSLSVNKKMGVVDHFTVGQRVVVYNATNDTSWNASVIQQHLIKCDNIIKVDKMLYKVRYDKWGKEYDKWVDAEELSKASKCNKVHRIHDFDSDYIPNELLSLRALVYLNDQYRNCGSHNIVFSKTTSELCILRYALLVIEAALPTGALDQSDPDRWDDNFAVAWREAVVKAIDCQGLMSCLVMLECCLRPLWIKQRFLLLMPSKSHALRTASLGQLSLRIWMLDEAIKYDKVVISDRDSSKKKRK